MRYEWSIADDPLDALTVLDVRPGGVADARDQFFSRPFALTTDGPLRVLLLREPTRDRVLVSASHVATDGAGAVRFLRSIDRAYRNEPDPVPAGDALVQRDLSRQLARSNPVDRLRRLAQSAALLRGAVDPPTRMASGGGQPGPGYGLVVDRLGSDDTAALIATAAGHGATVNDLLICAMHLAVEAWNTEHQAPCGRISVMMPMDLRPTERRGEVLGNLSLMVPVTASADERRSLATLRDSVMDQTRDAKTSGRAVALVEAMAIGSRLSIRARRALHGAVSGSDRLTDTTVLSNLGRLADPPQLGREPSEDSGVWFSPPCGMPNTSHAATSGFCAGSRTRADRGQPSSGRPADRGCLRGSNPRSARVAGETSPLHTASRSPVGNRRGATHNISRCR